MSEARWAAFLVTITICVLITFLSLEVDAQSTVDDGASCESHTLDEAVNIIREDFKDVKNLLGSNQQQNNVSSISRKDLEDLKAACTSNQQQCSKQSVVSSFISTCVPVLIQQNVNGSVNFFSRSWAEFKVGFNDTLGNYWLGNDLLSQLTLSRPYKLRMDFQARNLSWYYTEYSSFNVSGESHNYKLHVSGYLGNAGDALRWQTGMMFTTYDRDNDLWTDNCAVRMGGGFWYNGCGGCYVNSVRHPRDEFRSWSAQTGFLFLQTTRMWLMC